jgi:hypothetical protein
MLHGIARSLLLEMQMELPSLIIPMSDLQREPCYARPPLTAMSNR